MRNFCLFLCASLLGLCLVACGTNSDAPSDGGAGDATTQGGSTPLPCDVQAVLQANCQSCHQAQPINGAPMALMTWQDTQAAVLKDPDGPAPTSANEKVFQMMETRIHLASNPMPPSPHPMLGATDLATIDNWVNAGAPAGTNTACIGAEDGGGVPDGNAPTLNCNNDDTTVAPASDFSWDNAVDAGEVSNGTDLYVCYSVTLPVDDGGTRHIFGITPDIDNRDIVHHILFFQSDTNDTSVTSTPAPCQAGGSLLWRIVYGWAPGGGAMQTPPGVGFPYTASTQFIVQVHYNNIHGYTGQTDHTGFSLCTSDEYVPPSMEADVMAFGSNKFTIPAHGSLNTTCNITVPSLYAGSHVFAAFPHMHQLGTAIQTEQIENGSGPGIVDMAQNIPWNFNTQIWFPLNTVLNQGDTVSTRCEWTNPTDSNVGFGQYTEDEMCYSFTAYYPKIVTSLWTWDLPALESTCTDDDAGVSLPMPDGGWVPQGDSGAIITPIDAGPPLWGLDAGEDAGN